MMNTHLVHVVRPCCAVGLMRKVYSRSDVEGVGESRKAASHVM